jgi:hypothetical protein
MASNLLNTLEKIEKGRKKCIRLANEVNYPLPEDASLEQIAECIDAQGHVDEYYASYKAYFSKDFSALPDGKVRLPDEIERLGDYAFYYGRNLDLILPRQLKTIGQSAFNHASFKDKTFTIPETVTTLENYSFSNISSTTINVPSSVRTTELGSVFDHASGGTMNYDGRCEIINGSFGNNNAGTRGNGWNLNMTPESIACIKEIKNYSFNQCKIHKQPWNKDTKITGTHAFMNTLWYCPLELPANKTGALPANLFQNTYFAEELTWPTSNNTAVNDYAFSSVQLEKNTTFKIPESIVKLGTGCCTSMSAYDTVKKANSNLDRIEVLCKDTLELYNANHFQKAMYNHLIIHAAHIASIPANCMTQANTSTANGNIVFLNIKEVPSIVSTSFNASSLSKGNAYIYLPDDLVNEAKTKSNWTSFAARIKPLSEWPLYAEYAEHILPREEA